MIPDKALELAALTSAISASAATPNFLNIDKVDSYRLGDRSSDLNAKARKTFMRVVITADGTGTGTVEFKTQVDDNNSFSSPKDMGSSGAVVGNTIKKGTVYDVPFNDSWEQYLRGYVTITGTAGIKYSAYVYHAV